MFRTRTIQFPNLTREYSLSFYWSALTLTTLGEQVSRRRFDQPLRLIAIADSRHSVHIRNGRHTTRSHHIRRHCR